MKLSIVIVNYNVKFFLEQCLHSVEKACSKIEAEVFVVDNNSVDGSCQMVKEKFPSVILIENHDNKGFSKANNQAIQLSKGEYVLILNPDTIVEEDSFDKCVEFMDNHPEAGALGVKMIDGKGRFLPESKRGLPTPAVAFYKIFGFSKVFSKSKQFGRYHLGHLSKDETHEVDVLSGAYMFMRKTTLDKVGLLDEDYFMYGEDIDLSYRITQGGYKNYYFSGTKIIHYKGESTKKGSINYVKVFYKAMAIFAGKHFSKGRADMFSFLINLAIYFRAFLAIISRFAKAVFLPLLDGLVIFAGFLWLLPYWEKLKFSRGYYPDEFLHLVVPAYIFIWLISIWLSGGYQKPIKIIKLIRGLIWGSLSILVIYSMVDESLRFSRALILLGSVWAIVTLFLYRIVLSKAKPGSFRFDLKKVKRIVVVAKNEEAKRINDLISQSQLRIETIGLVYPDHTHHEPNFLGNIQQLGEIAKIHKIDEIIFSSMDLPSQEIIDIMLELTDLNIEYKIAPPKSLSIIGSNSIETAGELYVVHVNSISKDNNKRNKRLLDVSFSLFMLIIFPVSCWTIENKAGLFKNIFSTLSGKKSWVGYSTRNNHSYHLPEIKTGVISAADKQNINLSEQKKLERDMVYAKDYRILNDVEIILAGWKKLGR